MVDLTGLAVQATALSANLNKLRQQCGHESTSADISNVAGELHSLSKELIDLYAAVGANKLLYTDAFNQDLAEIKAHLEGIFEDISDCCKEMQKANDLHASAVGWLTKKRYVKKLQKHLEANKTTLVVMRTVLHHGKEYGMQKQVLPSDTCRRCRADSHSSPGRLAESSPHTMQEDRAILETVFASRSAIHDLHSLGSHEHSSSTSSTGTADTTPSFKPGAHGRNLSSATGVDVPAVEDVLPISEKKKKQDALARRFSRRGVRLAVHSSIMDTNAHDVPISLRKRWMHQAHLRRPADRFDADGRSNDQLSRISEVNSVSGPDEPLPTSSLQRASSTPGSPNERPSTAKTDSQVSSGSGRVSHTRDRSASLVNSPMGKKLGSVISRLSRHNLRERNKNAQDSPEPIEEQIYPPNEANVEGDSDKKGHGDAMKEMSAKQKPGWSYRLTRPFVKEELTTPDFERGF
ncbi:hypothetical protein H2200_008998 [Cladophialophora chaetospira]|uniref:Fungal N-terminal domain-containing protein n=1 Tax=Cladophialophora chaetospira TaxID=386627 RepID=A0AA38X522_9EURO|nr:hypothetical protein H2200_008998 [Cladophialophora chaetospira]